MQSPATTNEPATPRPAAIHLDRQKELVIRWSDGVESRYPLHYLRTKCPCATCRTPDAGTAAPVTPTATPGPGGISLAILPRGFDQRAVATGATLVGNYALQVSWADGHSTGIYDFRYLRNLDPAGGGGTSR